MKLHRKILCATFSLLLALGLFSLAACGKKETPPAPIVYTVTVTCEEEEILSDVKVALQTAEGETAEGGEAKALTAGKATFSMLPATYRVVLTGVPATYEWEAQTLSESSPAAVIALTRKSTEPTDPKDPSDPTDPTDPKDPTDPSDPTDPKDPTDPTDPTDPKDPTEPTDPQPIAYTVTVTCEEEEILSDVKVALQTAEGETAEGGEAKSLTAGKATFSMLPATYRVVLTGVPATYEWEEATLSESSPAAVIALTAKKLPEVDPSHLPAALGGVWEADSNTFGEVAFSGDTITVTGERGSATAEAANIVYSLGVWTFRFEGALPDGKIIADFTYRADTDELSLRSAGGTKTLTRKREAEQLDALPDVLAGTMWEPDRMLAGVHTVAFTATKVCIDGAFYDPSAIARLDSIYTFAVTYATNVVENTLTFTYDAAADALTAVNEFDKTAIAFTKQKTVSPEEFGAVAASVPDEIATALSAAAWVSEDEIVARVTFEKFNASYGIEVYILMKDGKGGRASVLIANGDIRKEGEVYQFTFRPGSGSNVVYTVLLRYDATAKSLTALYSDKTVSLKQETKEEKPLPYPAELEGTKWVCSDDEGAIYIRSIWFEGGRIFWEDGDGNTQEAFFLEENSSGIWVQVDPSTGITLGCFCINYSYGSMEIGGVGNLGSTNTFTFTKV